VSDSYAEIITRLKRNITSYYTATYSSDTNVHAILSTYAMEFLSGSKLVDEVYNNIFILTATTEKLYDNFGFYVEQSKYFQQNRTEDRWVAGSGSIPSYVKTMDFLFDAGFHGSTLHAVNRVSHAFTLINPDIRELYAVPRWKLHTFSGSIVATNNDVLTVITGGDKVAIVDPGWKRNEYQGGMVTLVSGSGINKVNAEYAIEENSQNTVTTGAI